MTGTYVLHVVTRPGAVVDVAVAAEVASGMEVRCVLLHDAVLADPPPASVVVRCAEDVRRRGLPPRDGDVDHAGIVALLAGAARVRSW